MERQREEARREGTKLSSDEGVAKKCVRTDRSDTQMDTEGGGEAGIYQSNSRHKKACDKPLPDRLCGYCGLCEGTQGVV